MTLIPVERARAAVRDAVAELRGDARESVPFRAAHGRVLAADVVAPFSLPRFTNSAMDGFAVRAADVADATEATPVALEKIGTVRAGEAQTVEVAAGTTVEVMTGAEIPGGADAVVPVEGTSGFDATPVLVRTPVSPRKNVRFAGEEVREGDVVIPASTLVRPAELGVIASLGRAEVEVFKRPRVVLFATGDELREPGEALQPGQIYNSNLHVLRELVGWAGGEVVTAEVIRDDREAVSAFLRRSVAEADIVVSSGGVSMGKFDFVHEALRAAGVNERFWKVAQKPAKPLYFAAGGDALFFGLPGNPISVTVGFIEYVWPALAALAHRAEPPRRRLPLAAPLGSDPAKHRFLFATLGVGDDGRTTVTPTTRLGSHMLTAALGADCLLEAPPGVAELARGTEVVARLLPWSEKWSAG